MDNTLIHYGILGMKWGIRRAPKQLARGARGHSKTDEIHEDYKKARTPKSIKSMSDAELRNRLNRLQMERQYSQLSESSVNKGKEYAQKLFKAGTTVAAVTTTALTIYNNIDKIRAILGKK